MKEYTSRHCEVKFYTCGVKRERMQSEGLKYVMNVLKGVRVHSLSAKILPSNSESVIGFLVCFRVVCVSYIVEVCRYCRLC